MSKEVLQQRKYDKLREELKAEMCKFLGAWWRIGQILSEIKENQLYKCEGLTWEGFCEKLTGYTRRQADNLIRDSDRHAVLEEFYRETGKILPALSADAIRATESMTEKQAMQAIDNAKKKGRSATAAKIRAENKPIIDAEPIANSTPNAKETSEPKCCPTCKRPL